MTTRVKYLNAIFANGVTDPAQLIPLGAGQSIDFGDLKTKERFF